MKRLAGLGNEVGFANWTGNVESEPRKTWLHLGIKRGVLESSTSVKQTAHSRAPFSILWLNSRILESWESLDDCGVEAVLLTPGTIGDVNERPDAAIGIISALANVDGEETQYKE